MPPANVPTRLNMPRWLIALIASAERIASLPPRPTTAAALARALAPMTKEEIAVALDMAGWRRESVWSRASDDRRKLTIWYSPPGGAAPRTPRGRPRIYATFQQSIAAVTAMGWLPARQPDPNTNPEH